MERKTKAGFTMVEMIIAVALLGVMVIAVGLTSRKATDAFDEGIATDALNSSAHRSIERLLASIEPADAGQLGPRPDIQNGWPRMTFRVATDWDAGAIQWSGTWEVEREMEPGEIDDGIDNDGDGLIDEGAVVLSEFVGTPTEPELQSNDPLPDERSVTLCRGVAELLEGELANGLDDNGNGLIDEPGFCVEVRGEVVTLRMTLQALDPDGRVLTKTVESSVWTRN